MFCKTILQIACQCRPLFSSVFLLPQLNTAATFISFVYYLKMVTQNQTVVCCLSFPSVVSMNHYMYRVLQNTWQVLLDVVFLSGTASSTNTDCLISPDVISICSLLMLAQDFRHTRERARWSKFLVNIKIGALHFHIFHCFISMLLYT